MGLLGRIKAWFGGSKGAKAAQQAEQAKLPPPTPEVETLLEEYKQLEGERSQMRKEIEDVEAQYGSGKIKAAARDRAYRVRLSRAGQIGFRQVEIRNRLVELKYPVPREWRASPYQR